MRPGHLARSQGCTPSPNGVFDDFLSEIFDQCYERGFAAIRILAEEKGLGRRAGTPGGGCPPFVESLPGGVVKFYRFVWEVGRS